MWVSSTSVAELSVAIPLLLGALGLCIVRCLAQVEQSRCTRVDCMCCHIERDPPAAEDAADVAGDARE
jgi:hypothetical protein